MKLKAKLLLVLIPVFLIFSVILLKGCGDSGQCGGCPSDSIAPANSTVTIVNSLNAAAVTTAGGCTNALTFLFKDSKGDPLNGICVEIFTNGFIKLTGTTGACSDPAGYVAGYMRTRTDAGGTVKVDFSSGSLVCGSATDIGYNFFVQVSSCSVGATTEATWTLDCTPL